MPLGSTLKNRLPLLGGATALALIAAGTGLTWRTLNADPGTAVRIASDPEASTPASAGGNAEMPLEGFRQGTKPPSAFGLPEYTSAFDYHSLEAGESGNAVGSSAFLVKQGSAADVADFYLLELGRKGWELVWQKDASAHPGNEPSRKALTGTRVRWIDARRERQVTLLALDDPTGKHTVQAVLSWARLPKTTATPSGGSSG